MILLAGLTVIGVGIGRILPTSFVPSEDQGYFFMQLQLPDAASLQRTDAVAREVEQVLAETEGIQSYTTIVGFSLLSNISQTYAGFYFVQLEPWDERGAAHRRRDHARAERAACASCPSAQAFALRAALDSRRRQRGRLRRDAPGPQRRDDVEYLAENAQRFIEAASKRPELAGVVTRVPPRRAAALRRA